MLRDDLNAVADQHRNIFGRKAAIQRPKNEGVSERVAREAVRFTVFIFELRDFS